MPTTRRTVLQTGGGHLGDALLTVFGLETARQMIPIGAADMAPAGSPRRLDEAR
jgi:hypothetical protein